MFWILKTKQNKLELLELKGKKNVFEADVLVWMEGQVTQTQSSRLAQVLPQALLLCNRWQDFMFLMLFQAGISPLRR